MFFLLEHQWHTCQHLYFTPISRPPPVLLFLPGNSRNLYGPNLVIWIITLIFYSKVVQLPDLEWNASPNASHYTIDTIHKFQTICDLNLATYNPVVLARPPGWRLSGIYGRFYWPRPAHEAVWQTCQTTNHSSILCRKLLNISHTFENPVFIWSW